MSSKIRFIHNVPRAPSVNVFLDGKEVLSNVAYKAVSDYLKVASGSHRVSVNPVGSDAPIVTKDIKLDSNNSYTLLIEGLLPHGKNLVELLLGPGGYYGPAWGSWGYPGYWGYRNWNYDWNYTRPGWGYWGYRRGYPHRGYYGRRYDVIGDYGGFEHGIGYGFNNGFGGIGYGGGYGQGDGFLEVDKKHYDQKYKHDDKHYDKHDDKHYDKHHDKHYFDDKHYDKYYRDDKHYDKYYRDDKHYDKYYRDGKHYDDKHYDDKHYDKYYRDDKHHRKYEEVPYDDDDKIYHYPAGVPAAVATTEVPAGAAPLDVKPQVELVLMQDDNNCPDYGKTKIRIVHGASGVPPVDVYNVIANQTPNDAKNAVKNAVKNTIGAKDSVNAANAANAANVKLVSDLAYGKNAPNGSYIPINAGDVNLVVKPAGSDKAVLGPLPLRLKNGEVYTIVLSGIPGDNDSPLTALMSEDSKCMSVNIQ